MFDVIGYWGVLTIIMMSPIVVALWLFTSFTNCRIKELGGKPVELFNKLDNLLDNPAFGIPVGFGAFIGLAISAVWSFGLLVKDEWFTYIGFFSKISEFLSPVSGFVILAVALLIAYDAALKGYVRVTKLVNKLEEKSES